MKIPSPIPTAAALVKIVAKRPASLRWMFLAVCAMWVPEIFLDRASFCVADDSGAVPAGARALDSWWDYPWYDDQNDSVRRIELMPPPPTPTATPTTTTTGGGWSGWSGLEAFGWILIAILLIAIMFMLWRAFQSRTRNTAGSTKAGLVGAAASVARLEDLPFRVEAAAGDLLSQAGQARAKADYNRAIVLLYSHLLLELDKRQAIRLTKGKTNRQYLRELREQPHYVPLLAPSMFAFEEVFFGGRSLSADHFERCWQQAAQLLSEAEHREAA